MPVLVSGQCPGTRPPTRRRRRGRVGKKKMLGRGIVAPSRAAQLPSRRARSCRCLPCASKTHRWCRRNALGDVSLFSGAVMSSTPTTVTSRRIRKKKKKKQEAQQGNQENNNNKCIDKQKMLTLCRTDDAFRKCSSLTV